MTSDLRWSVHPGNGPFAEGLDRNGANYAPLTPLSFLLRTAAIHPERVAVIHGRQRLTYHDLLRRSLRLASALERHGIRPGDTVAAMLPNIPAMLEAHHGVPMCGAILNALNTRLDAAALAFILQHGEAKALLTDTEFAPLMREAVRLAGRKILVVDVDDREGPGGEKIGHAEYEAFIAAGDPDYRPLFPADEWQAIALNYTSGTTGNPKGVVYHHRGAALMAYTNTIHAGMGKHPVYCWTVPKFHYNG
jgi:fatty-acyl-CoA synthase